MIKIYLTLIAFCISGAAHSTFIGVGDISVTDGVISMTSGFGSVSTAAVESSLSLADGTLNALVEHTSPDILTTEGSAFAYSVDLNAGDALSFEWIWSSFETSDSDIYNDLAFASIAPGAELIADTWTLNGTNGIFQYVAAAAGTYTLGAGVMDVDDPNDLYYSQLIVSNLSVSSVPLPAAFWFMGTALVGLMGYSRKSKYQPVAA